MDLSLMLLLGAIIFILVMVLFRATQIADKSVPKEGAKVDDKISSRAAESLSAMIKYPTLSEDAKVPDDSQSNRSDSFERMISYIRSRYPKIFRILTVEDIEGNLLLHWSGSDYNKDPMLFCANMDVVSSEGNWEHPHYSGVIAENKVWGRGAIEAKGVLCALLEATELLLREGFRPKRDIYVAIVRDAESKNNGARILSEALNRRTNRFAAVFGRGSCISRDLLPLDRAQAIIGVAEKGTMKMKLSAKERGGSISSPPRYSAIGRLSEAICRLEFRPQSIRKSEVMRKMIEAFSPYMPFRLRVYAANLWLFEGKLLKALQNYEGFSSMLRTTFAVTQTHSGGKEKLMPSTAEATVYARLISGDSCSDIFSFLEDLLGPTGVSIDVELAEEASAISNYSGEEYRRLKDTLQEVFGGIIIAPGILSEDTSLSPFKHNADAVYRITPFVLTEAEKATIRSVNERLDVETLGRGVYFYKQLISSM